MVESSERGMTETDSEQPLRTQRRRSRELVERSSLRKACRWSFSGIEEATETAPMQVGPDEVNCCDAFRTETVRRRRSGSVSDRARSSITGSARERVAEDKAAGSGNRTLDSALEFVSMAAATKSPNRERYFKRNGRRLSTSVQNRLKGYLGVLVVFLQRRSVWLHTLIATTQQWRTLLQPSQQQYQNRAVNPQEAEHQYPHPRLVRAGTQSKSSGSHPKAVRFDPTQNSTKQTWPLTTTLMFFFSGWLTALLYAVGGWLHRVSQRMRSLGVLRPLPMMAFVRARHLLNWIRDRLLSPGFKPLLLGLASAQVLGGVSYDLSEWLARLMLERLAQVVTQGRMDSATLVESIQFGGLLPRFSKLSCGSYLAYASRPSERKILVLDLDETLVHSSFKDSAGCDLSVEVDVDDVPTVFFVRKRPHLELFIRIARQWYDLVIFTASLRRYADPLIDALDPTGSLFCARYFRDDCVRLPPYNFVKNLSTVSPNLGKVIIVDNSPASYAMHAANALPIDAWYDDPFDEELLNLLPVLRSLSILEDVRSVLGLRLTRGSLMSRYRPLVAT